MRNATSFLTVAALAALFVSGCAGPEQKLGRGMRNVGEIVRLGELRRSIEQTSVFESPGAGATAGVIRGIDRSLARAGVGLFEIVTSPLPPYDPKFIAPNPAYPDSYKPGLTSCSTLDTDTYTGYSGGDVVPFIPGSRFKVFDN